MKAMRKIEYIAPETMVVVVDTETIMNVSYTTVHNTETGQDEQVVTSITKYDVWDEGQDPIDVY